MGMPESFPTRTVASYWWITIADGRGTDLRAVAGGITVKRVPGARTAAIVRLRIEMTFRTTSPRTVAGIAVKMP
jgi:hypothetical protein